MSTSNRYICIHGHFYQPPRANAWLEEVEIQDTAAPFHDWNERINYECYAPNTAARIKDADGKITRILNNYSRISFNFGPTLHSWMEKADPATYKAILKADKKSQERFGGHGSAIAQVYGHLILPLANKRDKETQVLWGIRDFEHRFGRYPEGMWLSETAVDTETLEVLAKNDIQFTILAPRQARAIQKIGEEEWTEVNEGALDTRRPYLCRLPSGKSIVLFFYHGGIAQGVAFERLLNNGKHFANRFMEAFDGDQPQLVHIATDGESYGHHHAHGEMALADCLSHIEEQQSARLTNYGEFLEKFPPEYEARIHDNSSWSCIHGVERWRSACGCTTDSQPGWTLEWRKPLRDTLDWLRDQLIPIFEKEAEPLLKNPWRARENYIDVILNRTEERIARFVEAEATRPLSKAGRTKMLRLLEMQRQAMQMFTSCGWFFGEISRIETDQILQYANRAIHYAHQVAGVNLHQPFLAMLEKAPSNKYENGASSYIKFVIPARVDLIRAGMHYAASSLFEEYPEHLEFFNYIADSEVYQMYKAGNQKLAVGRTILKSKVSYSEKHFSFAVLYLGQLNILGYISIDMDLDSFKEMHSDLDNALNELDIGDLIGIMQTYFGTESFTIWHLFRDEKRKILKQITDGSLRHAEIAFRDIYNDNYFLMAGASRAKLPVPNAYKSAAEFVIKHDLDQFFQNGRFNVKELERLAREIRIWGIEFDQQHYFRLAASERIFKEIAELDEENGSRGDLQNLISIVRILNGMKVNLDIWKSQNIYFSRLNQWQKGKWIIKDEEWQRDFLLLGELLNVRTS